MHGGLGKGSTRQIWVPRPDPGMQGPIWCMGPALCHLFGPQGQMFEHHCCQLSRGMLSADNSPRVKGRWGVEEQGDSCTRSSLKDLNINKAL